MITSEQIKKEWQEQNGWYRNPATNLWLRIGDGTKIGDWTKIGNGTEIGDGTKIGNWAEIGDGTKIGNEAEIGDGTKIGNWAEIGDGTKIGNWTGIGNRAEIGNGTEIGNEVTVVSVIAKYVGTLAIRKNGIEIRIGCECHSPKYWEEHGAALARKNGESQWWEATGKHLLNFLKHEVDNFKTNKPKRDTNGRFCN